MADGLRKEAAVQVREETDPLPVQAKSNSPMLCPRQGVAKL